MSEYPIFVYVIGRPDGPCKIGVSRDPDKRLSMLRTGCPFYISVLFRIAFETRKEARENESWFFYCHPDLRILGEWYDIAAEQAASWFSNPECAPE